MTHPLALAIDIGSSAVRSAAVDASGRIVAAHRVQRHDATAGVVFDPEQLWRDVVRTIRAISADVRHSVATIGIAGHVGTVFVDSALDPIERGRGWADSAGVGLLIERAGDRLPELLRETGRPTATGGAAASFIDLEARAPGVARRVAHVLSPKDFVIARLCGRIITDRTSAAYTGLSAVASGSWSSELLDLVGLRPAQMPSQLDATDLVGGVTASVAALLGLPTDAVVVAGGTDGTVGATYVIEDRRDVLADIAGTTDVLVRLVGHVDDAPPGSVVNPYTLGGFSAGGPTGATGGALARWAQLLGFEDVQKAVEFAGGRLAAIGPGAHGLLIEPSLSGSRFPRWRPQDAGAVLGQRDDHRAEHFLLAAMEGAAYVVREGIDRLDPSRTDSVVLAGGAARSRELAQLRSDVLGRDVLVCAEPDVSLLGAAFLAFRGRGIDAPPRTDRMAHTLHPRSEVSAAYDSLFATWRRVSEVD